jgi:hypothetical protein
MTKIKWNISLAGSIEKAHGQVIVIEEELLRRTMDESDQLVSEMAAQNALTSSRAERQCTNHTRQPLCQHHPRCTAVGYNLPTLLVYKIILLQIRTTAYLRSH